MTTNIVNESLVRENNNDEVTNYDKERHKLCDVNTGRIYLSHILTSWGDRMWSFAVALFLVVLFPESLQYTAIFGFTTCICVIIGGPCIGKWVDKSSRLKAATFAIVVQNLAVSFSAVLLIVMIHFREKLQTLWNGNSEILFLCAIILFAVIGELASVGSKIAIEKDWIVVLAQNDETRLSKMNSTMRTIDLTTSILAPAVVAQIIHYISNIAGAAFIAGWNIVSGTIEIYLLHKIFASFPELAQAKKVEGKTSSTKIPAIIIVNPTSPYPTHDPKGAFDLTTMNTNNNGPSLRTSVQSINKDILSLPTTPGIYKTSFMAEGHLDLPGQSLFDERGRVSEGSGEKQFISTPRGLVGLPAEDFTQIALTPLQNQEQQGKQNGEGMQNIYSSSKSIDDDGFDKRLTKSSDRLFKKEPKTRKQNCCERCFRRTVESLSGWNGYFRSPLMFAGLGLALLYMTVLGFDSITIGYMYSQGVSESLIGILTAIGAVSGILGSLSFPFLRRKLGKCAVGNFGFGFETVCLILCVISVIVPGSPFVPESLWSPSDFTDSASSESPSNPNSSTAPKHHTYTSVILFSTGILISRYGLWIADLSVTQFFQEEVPEAQRGILNGVQDSLNQVLNLVKFILVIIYPKPEMFGYLIILSWLFVLSGWVSFMIFTCSWKRRLNKIKCAKTDTATLVQLAS